MTSVSMRDRSMENGAEDFKKNGPTEFNSTSEDLNNELDHEYEPDLLEINITEVESFIKLTIKSNISQESEDNENI
ncbi:10593_t:CDS:2 [Entrophospora sp. SA101]|nr:10593_t:CDS:2 [Entrophospora sp. SA101]